MALSTAGDRLSGLSLCAGYGGLELGLHIAEPGYRTVCFVEREAHASAALVARMEDQALDRAPIWDDLATFDGSPWRGKVHIVSAGYPCQPFSSVGRRRGADDPRHLWPQVARVIGEVRPEWVLLENVLGHLSLGFSEVGAELRTLGFATEAGVFSAYEVGANHVRPRLFALAHTADRQQQQPGGSASEGGPASIRSGDRQSLACGESEPCRHRVDPVLAAAAIQQIPAGRQGSAVRPLFPPAPSDFASWHRVLGREPHLEPAVRRMADGVADELDELRGAGNGVCPLAAALAYRTLRSAFESRSMGR